MPTARKRFQVTETDELERALDAAAGRWPGESRSRLLLRIINAGEEVVLAPPSVVGARRAAIKRLSSSYADGFDPNYLNTLRADWPE